MLARIILKCGLTILFFNLSFSAYAIDSTKTGTQQQKARSVFAKSIQVKSVDILLWARPFSASWKPTCPDGASYISGQYVEYQGQGHHFFRCAFNYTQKDTKMISFLSRAGAGFTTCPFPNTNVTCTTKFRSAPVTTFKTTHCTPMGLTMVRKGKVWSTSARCYMHTWLRMWTNTWVPVVNKYAKGTSNFSGPEATFTGIILPGSYLLQPAWRGKGGWKVNCSANWWTMKESDMGKTCTMACSDQFAFWEADIWFRKPYAICR